MIPTQWVAKIFSEEVKEVDEIAKIDRGEEGGGGQEQNWLEFRLIKCKIERE